MTDQEPSGEKLPGASQNPDQEKKSFVYIVECCDGTYYTGWTTFPRRREAAHNSGKGAKYTKSRRPVHLIYTEQLTSKQEAMRREYEIKHLTRKEKEELVHSERNLMGRPGCIEISRTV